MNYLKVYFNLVNSRKFLNRPNLYTEIHHIIPKSIYGKGLMDDKHIADVNDKDNLVELTGREHFIAHWLLHRVFKENKKLQGAFWAMTMISPSQERDYIPSSRAVAEAREAHSKARRIPVARYSMDGALMDTFNSAGEASRNFSCSESVIHQASSGNIKSAMGFQWRQYEIEPKKYIEEHSVELGPHVKLGQYDLNGNLINEFESFLEASRELNIEDGGIRAGIKRNSKLKNKDYFFIRFSRDENVPKKVPKYNKPCTKDSKPVIMLSADYRFFIKRFGCIRKAQEFLNKSGREQIARVASKTGGSDSRNTSWGFGWMWETEYDLGLPTKDIDEVNTYEHSKKVIAYTLSGDFVKEFESASAAARYHNVGTSSITFAIHNRGTCKNLQWWWKKDINEGGTVSEIKAPENMNKVILKIDCKSNEVLEEFESISDAARAIGQVRGNANISACANGKRKSAYGFNWRFS